VDYDPGSVQDVELHDGSHLRLKKLDKGYDPRNRELAITTMLKANEEKQFLTGLMFIDEKNRISSACLIWLMHRWRLCLKSAHGLVRKRSAKSCLS